MEDITYVFADYGHLGDVYVPTYRKRNLTKQHDEPAEEAIDEMRALHAVGARFWCAGVVFRLLFPRSNSKKQQQQLERPMCMQSDYCDEATDDDKQSGEEESLTGSARHMTACTNKDEKIKSSFHLSGGFVGVDMDDEEIMPSPTSIVTAADPQMRPLPAKKMLPPAYDGISPSRRKGAANYSDVYADLHYNAYW